MQGWGWGHGGGPQTSPVGCRHPHPWGHPRVHALYLDTVDTAKTLSWDLLLLQVQKICQGLIQ